MSACQDGYPPKGHKLISISIYPDSRVDIDISYSNTQVCAVIYNDLRGGWVLL